MSSFFRHTVIASQCLVSTNNKVFMEGCNGNRKFSFFWCKMKDFLSLQNTTILTKKFRLLFEILSFEKTTDFCSKKYFLTSDKATMT